MVYIIIFILSFFLSYQSVAYSDINIRNHNGIFCYDGDTCYVEIDGEIRDTEGRLLKIRLLELDTPEISKPKCDKELEWGFKARNYINNLIMNAATVSIETDYSIDNKKYNRTLAHIIVDGKNVSELMVKNNLGVVYQQDKKKDWCE